MNTRYKYQKLNQRYYLIFKYHGTQILLCELHLKQIIALSLSWYCIKNKYNWISGKLVSIKATNRIVEYEMSNNLFTNHFQRNPSQLRTVWHTGGVYTIYVHCNRYVTEHLWPPCHNMPAVSRGYLCVIEYDSSLKPGIFYIAHNPFQLKSQLT